jgi:apolipoprotein N-acyltransferase
MLKSLFHTYKTPLEKKQDRKELLYGLLSGILLGASFPPSPLPYLIFIALPFYLAVITKNKSLGQINRFTYFTFLIFNIVTLYWVGSWTPDADTFLMIAGSVLIFFNPLLFLIPSTLYYYTKEYLNKNLALFFLPWFWLFYEYIYSITDFKFPWLSLSNGLPKFTEYIQIADIIGSYGLTVLIVYANVFVYLSIRKFKRRNKIGVLYAVLFLLVIILPLFYGLNKVDNKYLNNEKIKVGLIQPNLNPNKKWETGNLNEQIDSYLELSNRAIKQGAEIVIWPETALPVYLLTDRYKKETSRLQTYVDTTNITLITGMPHVNYFNSKDTAPNDAKPIKGSSKLYTSYNSILYFSPQNNVTQYGKIELVPFGEKVPLVDVFPILGKWIKWNVGISSWNTGKEKVIFNYKKDSTQIKIGGVICIESIYPFFIASFVEKGAEFIAVVTNDSWYGNSSGPYQHKEISVLRAVENRRTIVRAANGGISCIIYPNGKTISETEMFTKRVLVGDVILNNKLTFFTKHPLLLPYVAIAVSILSLIISIVIKIKG